jgi:hypothetical protein
MGERREYPHGRRVHITGGIYQKHGDVGEKPGSTRCMVDVYVPVLKREVRGRIRVCLPYGASDQCVKSSSRHSD